VLLGTFADPPVRERIRAVVVEGSFHSYQEVAASVLWRHPLLFPLTGLGYALVSDDGSPAATVGQVAPTPLLVIHDLADPIVPWRFGAALFELAQEPKTFWLAARGGHIRATKDVQLRHALLAWLERPGWGAQGPPAASARSRSR
jgi:fermentation-respiration switch protein FrsA (DUF1100 family)